VGSGRRDERKRDNAQRHERRCGVVEKVLPLLAERVNISDDGSVLATPPFPMITTNFDVISSSTIYVPQEGTAYEVMTAEALWSNALKSEHVITPRAATGSRVLFVYESKVYTATF
jgi:hypothetical protein